MTASAGIDVTPGVWLDAATLGELQPPCDATNRPSRGGVPCEEAAEFAVWIQCNVCPEPRVRLYCESHVESLATGRMDCLLGRGHGRVRALSVEHL